MKTIVVIFLTLFILSCSSSDSSAPSNNTPTAPTTELVVTINNFSDKLVLGMSYFDENHTIQQINFTSALNPLETGVIQIDVTAICDYDIDFGLRIISPVYNLGGGNLFVDALTQELIMFNCRTNVPVINIDCNLVIDSLETTGYKLTCTDTFNNV